MTDRFPCGTPKPDVSGSIPADEASRLMGPPVDLKRVDDIASPGELLTQCMSRFGGGYVRRIYEILDRAISEGVPLIISIAGPITVSNQHRAWLIPLLETGWVAYITVTDAICYHDGHFSLPEDGKNPVHEVAIEGMDEAYRDAKVIRVTDAGFKEDILFDQDRFISAVLRQPEFQKKMTGTEFRNKLGSRYAAQEKLRKVDPGLLATCWRLGIPVFVGAPGDGSAFLNSVKLWALKQLGRGPYDFELDLHAEVMESAAYHYWGLNNGTKKLGVLILGGGVPKNFTLQPEPFLSQILLLDGIRGYDYDVQIVSSPVTDGSLSSCKPAEAHTWGKVSKEALASSVESFQGDYSTVMPLIAWALLDKRNLYRKALENIRGSGVGPEQSEELLHLLIERNADLPGYALRSHLRLYDRREALVEELFRAVRDKVGYLQQTLDYPLAPLE